MNVKKCTNGLVNASTDQEFQTCLNELNKSITSGAGLTTSRLTECSIEEWNGMDNKVKRKLIINDHVMILLRSLIY